MKAKRFIIMLLGATLAVTFASTTALADSSLFTPDDAFDGYWTENADGSITHNLSGGNLFVVPTIDATKSFKVSFDVTFEDGCTKDFPAVGWSLYTAEENPEAKFFSWLKLSPGNDNFLIEAQYLDKTPAWNTIGSASWAQAAQGARKLSVVLERVAGENTLNYKVMAGDVVCREENVFVDKMGTEKFLECTALKVSFEADGDDATVYTISGLSILNDGKELMVVAPTPTEAPTTAGEPSATNTTATPAPATGAAAGVTGLILMAGVVGGFVALTSRKRK